MIIEYIRYEMNDHPPGELIEAYEMAAKLLQNAPECLGYELTAAEDTPSSLMFRILWTSSEAHTQGFRTGPNFPPFLALVRPFIGEIVEMRHYISTGVAWSR